MSGKQALGLATMAALIGTGILVGPAGNPPATIDGSPARPIESDLRLDAVLRGAGPLSAGADPWIEVVLVNASRTATHRVVKVGLGSEIGTREPHVTWSATIDRGDGIRLPIVDERKYGYCGTCLMSAANWTRDTVPVRPGGRLELAIPPKFEFQRAGRVRLQAHYEYRAGDRRGETRPRPKDFASMAGVPPFKLVSNPVEFDVIRPLDLRVQVLQTLEAKRSTRLSDLLAVSLVNLSRDPIECSSPTLHADARLDIEFEGKHGGWRPSLSLQSTTYGVKRTLRPGEAVPLLGKDEFANGIDGTWEYPGKDRVRVRAAYYPTTWKPGPKILSEWVEVEVVE